MQKVIFDFLDTFVNADSKLNEMSLEKIYASTETSQWSIVEMRNKLKQLELMDSEAFENLMKLDSDNIVREYCMELYFYITQRTKNNIKIKTIALKTGISPTGIKRIENLHVICRLDSWLKMKKSVI